MSDIFYPSERKYERAKMAVASYARESGKHPDKAEYKLIAEGIAKGLKGDELIAFVYEGLSGAPVLAGAPAKEAKKKADEAKARTAKNRDAALRRERVSVK